MERKREERHPSRVLPRKTIVGAYVVIPYQQCVPVKAFVGCIQAARVMHLRGFRGFSIDESEEKRYTDDGTYRYQKAHQYKEKSHEKSQVDPGQGLSGFPY